jgi:glycosyltransferase involved in cell wall biosynthesis
MSHPTVSIIVPTYNRRDLLPRALDSIVAQTFSDWEIVLVDDGSNDGTDDLAAEYAAGLGDRLVYLRQDNLGSSAARNRGIEACRGRFVAFLDSDDEFVPHKLDRQLQLFELRPELGFVYSDYAYVDLEGVDHPSSFDTNCRLAREVPSTAIAPGLHVCGDDLFDCLLRGYFIATIVGMVRRRVLGEGIRFATDQAYAEEWLFHLAVTSACRAGFVDEPLSVHHFVEGSLARTDKHRNAVGYRDLLVAIDRAFDDLTREQRRTVHRNLRQAWRQLGYDAQRAERHGEALRCFAKAWRCAPSFTALGETFRAAIRVWLGGGGAARAVGRPDQDATGAVR